MRIAAFVAALFAVLVVGAPAGAQPATSVADGALCDVTITVPAQWSNGYTVSVTVRNISTVPVTWRANVTLPPPGYIIQIWNASVTQAGALVWIYPPPYGPTGGVLLPGQSHTFGYVGTGPLVLPVVTCG